MDRSYRIWTISQLKLLKLVKTHQASSLGRTRVAKQGLLSRRQLLLLPSYLLFNGQRKSGPGIAPPSLSWDIYHLPPCGPGFLSRLLERAAGPTSRWPSLASAALERVWSVCPLRPTLKSTSSYPQGADLWGQPGLTAMLAGEPGLTLFTLAKAWGGLRPWLWLRLRASLWASARSRACFSLSRACSWCRASSTCFITALWSFCRPEGEHRIRGQEKTAEDMRHTPHIHSLNI